MLYSQQIQTFHLIVDILLPHFIFLSHLYLSASLSVYYIEKVMILQVLFYIESHRTGDY